MPTTTTSSYTAAPRVTVTTGSLVGHGLAATVLASGATVAVAAAGQAAGISLDVGGAPIPVLGFGTLTPSSR